MDIYSVYYNKVYNIKINLFDNLLFTLLLSFVTGMASHVPWTQAQNPRTVQHPTVLFRLDDWRMVQSEYII